MNTSTLLAIAKALKKDLIRCDSVAFIKEAIEALQHVIKDPQNQKQKNNFDQALSNLYKRLDESPVQEFSATWCQAMKNMGVYGNFGAELKDELSEIVERGRLTDQVTLKALVSIHDLVRSTQNNLSELIAALEHFNVGEDELKGEECEVGITIPRDYVDNNLKKFGFELRKMEKMLLVFSELAGDSREPIRIRYIASSDLQVLLSFGYAAAAFIAYAVEHLANTYKTYLEIKNLRLALGKENYKVPPPALEQIESHVDSYMTDRIGEISEEIINKVEAKIKRSRSNELKNEVRSSLTMMVARIDAGVKIEIRTPEFDEKPESEEDEKENKPKTIEPFTRSDAVRQIKNASKALSNLSVPGKPILSLPDHGNGGNDDSEK